MNSRRVLQQSILLVIIGIFIVFSALTLSTRSVWVDEATLLKNIYDTAPLGFLQPLPYYDLASPFLTSVVLKCITEVAGANFELTRLLIFLFMLSCTAPLFLKIKRAFGLNTLVFFILIYGASIFPIVYYGTEIKHYGFEISAVFLFLYWLLIYFEKPEIAFEPTLIWLPLISIAIGFSTLLLVPSFFLFVLVDSFFKSGKGSFSLKLIVKQHGYIAALMLITAGAVYVLMKQATIFQINNSWSEEVYGDKGLFTSIKQIRGALIGAYSNKLLFIIAAISSVAALTISKGKPSFRLGVFFISTLISILFLKLTGLYPVVYSRHVVWIVPISMAMTTLLLNDLSSSSNKLHYLSMIAITAMIIGAIALNVYKLVRGMNDEHTNNDALYSMLEKFPASDVLVFSAARPSLEIYQRRNTFLSKHRFFGLIPGSEISSIKPPIDLEKEKEFTERQFNELPQIQSFLLILSHTSHIDVEPNYKAARIRHLALRQTLDKHHCSYRSMFKDNDVQIVKVSCAQPEDNK